MSLLVPPPMSVQQFRVAQRRLREQLKELGSVDDVIAARIVRLHQPTPDADALTVRLAEQATAIFSDGELAEMYRLNMSLLLGSELED